LALALTQTGRSSQAAPPRRPDLGSPMVAGGVGSATRPASAEEAAYHGVLPAQFIAAAIRDGVIRSDKYQIPFSSLQPASLDLRLGETAYRLRCSFLPGEQLVDERLAEYAMESIDLRDGAILERNRPYLIPLLEELRLPDGLEAKANPKSSTGRVDVFTRVITDRSHKFDDISHGYRGKLFLEVASRSFTIKVKTGLSLNQLRLMSRPLTLTDEQLFLLHERLPVLYRDGQSVPLESLALADGLFLTVDLTTRDHRHAGFKARRNSKLLDLTRANAHDPRDFWEPVFAEQPGRLVLEPEEFYLLLSREGVRIPPAFAAEMTPYDPTAGELRTHYAGFFDPGFGHGHADEAQGARAALEVRAHDVPFMIENGQEFCKLGFEPMAARPALLYGDGIGSNYQYQEVTLSKHFRFDRPPIHRQLLLPFAETPRPFNWHTLLENVEPEEAALVEQLLTNAVSPTLAIDEIIESPIPGRETPPVRKTS
jgi:dCTP deaminase